MTDSASEIDFFWGLAVLFFGLLGLVFYFLPTFVAGARRSKNYFGVLFLNLFLGWTLLIWVVCFVWACVSKQHQAVSASSDTKFPEDASVSNAQTPKANKGCGLFSVAINFVLLGLLIFYLIYPSWVLKHRHQVVQFFQNTFHAQK